METKKSKFFNSHNSSEVPQKIWAGSVQPFGRLLYNIYNKKTDTQTSKEFIYIELTRRKNNQNPT